LIYLIGNKISSLRQNSNSVVLNIFVAKLNFKTRKEALEAHSSVRSLPARLCMTENRAVPKAMPLLKYPMIKRAATQFRHLNDKEFAGRVLAVKPANPKPSENQFPGE
jgi:hypothetical protein